MLPRSSSHLPKSRNAHRAVRCKSSKKTFFSLWVFNGLLLKAMYNAVPFPAYHLPETAQCLKITQNVYIFFNFASFGDIWTFFDELENRSDLLINEL